MERLEFQSTTKTPYVLLDPAGKIQLRGRSIPEDVSLFYEVLLNWMSAYSAEPAIYTDVEIEMEYLNSGSSKYVLKLLKVIKDISDKGYDMDIKWVYEEGDDDIFERGEYYASILDLKINFIEIE